MQRQLGPDRELVLSVLLSVAHNTQRASMVFIITGGCFTVVIEKCVAGVRDVAAVVWFCGMYVSLGYLHYLGIV